MKKLAVVLLLGMAFAGSVYADEVKPKESAFHRYVAEPVQWVHRAAWGAATLAIKVGKAPIDAAFKLVGSTIGSEPNEPLWS